MSPEDRLAQSQTLLRALYNGILRREPDEEGMARWTEALVNGRDLTDVVLTFVESDEFRRPSPVKLFVPPGHYYSPVVDPAEAGRAFAKAEAKPVPESLPGIALDRAAMVQTWQSLLLFLSRDMFPVAPSPGYRYAYENPSYSWGDGGVLQAMIRRFRPKQIIEIGNGWSSACMIDTVELYLNAPCEITFIDPYPQLLRGLIGEAAARFKIYESPIQDIALDVFDGLQRNDILFIDSTHVLRTGSDVCFELFEILPRLASGVLVHFHDMFWPFEYPRAWAIDENRSWNELYAIRAFLTNNDEWEIVMFNDYLAKFERPMVEATWPKFLLNCGGALWLRRK